MWAGLIFLTVLLAPWAIIIAAFVLGVLVAVAVLMIGGLIKGVARVVRRFGDASLTKESASEQWALQIPGAKSAPYVLGGVGALFLRQSDRPSRKADPSSCRC